VNHYDNLLDLLYTGDITKSEIETLQSQMIPLNELIDLMLQCKNDDELKALIPKWAKVKPLL